MEVKLYTVRIFVHDWDAACRFYGETLGLAEKFRSAEDGWAEFDVGGPSLGVERVEAGDDEGASMVGRFVGVSLVVDDIGAVYNELLAKGVAFAEPPQQQSWGGTLCHLKDPSGNILTLLSTP